MQFTAGLTGEAATLARQHGDVLGRLPATVHAFILVELQKWPTLFGPEQRYQRALLEHLSRLPGAELDQAAAGIGRIEAEAGANRLGERNENVDWLSPGAAKSTGSSRKSIRRWRRSSIPPMLRVAWSSRFTAAASRSSETGCGAGSKAPVCVCR